MISDSDLFSIKAALGRSPRGAFKIFKRTNQGSPLVLKMYPLLNAEPFPTLYYLCHKQSIEKISQAESQGGVRLLENFLTNLDQGPQLMRQTHLQYAQDRWEYLNQSDREKISGTATGEVLKNSGIGGLRNFLSVKCLHMHYAHYLCGENILGEKIERLWKPSHVSGK